MSTRSSLTAAASSIALLLALTACGTSSAASTDTGSDDAAATSAAAESTPETAGIGTPVAVGSFEFTVSAVNDIGATIGSDPVSQTAQGTYLQVDLQVANIGSEPETFFVNNVTLVDAAGNSYDADPTAAIYLGDASNTWISAINPGNTLAGSILFDVPAGTQAVTLQVSDSAFSSGESISLQ